MEKCKTIVSRRWKTDAAIEAFINNDEVGARMALKEFLLALATEMNDLGVDRDLVKRSLLAASDRVVMEMKQTTKYVV